MKINHLKYIPLANFSSVYETKLTDTELQKTLARVDCQQALVILSRLASIHIRFLYKGIIIKHNKTEPTYTKTSLFLCEKRRFFMARTEKGVVTTI